MARVLLSGLMDATDLLRDVALNVVVKLNLLFSQDPPTVDRIKPRHVSFRKLGIFFLETQQAFDQ